MTFEPVPTVLVAAALALVLFAQALARLRRRGRADHAGWWRVPIFVGAVVLGAGPLLTMGSLADERLTWHMVEHLLIGDLSPLLAVLALRGPLTFFMLPPPVLRTLAPVRPLRAFLRFLLRPWTSFAVWLTALLAWHLPVAYDAAERHPLLHNLEHVSFVLAGVLAWTQLVDPAREWRLSRPGRILFAVGLIAAGHPVMDSLLFSGRTIYSAYPGLTDQRVAGATMLAEQLVTLGGCIAVLLWPYLSGRRAGRATLRQAA